jgi:3-hydroxybutyryl-CoA dehydrogenase
MIDAMRLYEDGMGSVPDIDAAIKGGAAHPMGPLVLADFIGLDTIVAACDALYAEFGEARYTPPPILKRMHAAGWYGRKSGMGFYDYSGPEPVENPGLA